MADHSWLLWMAGVGFVLLVIEIVREYLRR